MIHGVFPRHSGGVVTDSAGAVTHSSRPAACSGGPPENESHGRKLRRGHNTRPSSDRPHHDPQSRTYSTRGEKAGELACLLS